MHERYVESGIKGFDVLKIIIEINETLILKFDGLHNNSIDCGADTYSSSTFFTKI